MKYTCMTGLQACCFSVLHELAAAWCTSTCAVCAEHCCPVCSRPTRLTLLLVCQLCLCSQVKKLNDCIGDEVKQAVADAKDGEVGGSARGPVLGWLGTTAAAQHGAECSSGCRQALFTIQKNTLLNPAQPQ